MRKRVDEPDTTLELLAGEDEQGLYIILVRNQRHAYVEGHRILSMDKMMLVVVVEVVEVMQHCGQHMHIVITQVDFTVLCLLGNSLATCILFLRVSDSYSKLAVASLAEVL